MGSLRDWTAGGGGAAARRARPQVEPEEAAGRRPALDSRQDHCRMMEDGGLFAFNALNRGWPALVAVKDGRKDMVHSSVRNGVAYFGSQTGACTQ